MNALDEVRNTIVYVLMNARKHGSPLAMGVECVLVSVPVRRLRGPKR